MSADGPPAPRSLAELLREDPFQAYAYAYPHKTAYRPLDPPVPLREAWADEDRSRLFLYLHVPFCEQRCGFCNLFTQVQPRQDAVARYLDAVERQAAVVAAQLGPIAVARMAIGGGTPTFLSPAQLERLFRIAAACGWRGAPCSVETSPGTADDERLALLAAHGVTRVSIGVQSVAGAETAALHRHQDAGRVAHALRAMAAAGIPARNADLIYGVPGQTAASLRASIDAVRGWGANELYLYPLYVRPMTTLGRRGQAPGGERLALYRAAREHLLATGWRQATMRMFRAADAPDAGGPAYRCQDDGMLGLGAGARSYTRALHYAGEYAVAQEAIRGIVARWCAQDDADFALARHGIRLDAQDQRRRYVILSLLEQGLDLDAYRARFGGEALDDLPELAELPPLAMVAAEPRRWRLSAAGLERSDVIGRWLYSRRVDALMAAWRPG